MCIRDRLRVGRSFRRLRRSGGGEFATLSPLVLSRLPHACVQVPLFCRLPLLIEANASSFHVHFYGCLLSGLDVSRRVLAVLRTATQPVWSRVVLGDLLLVLLSPPACTGLTLFQHGAGRSFLGCVLYSEQCGARGRGLELVHPPPSPLPLPSAATASGGEGVSTSTSVHSTMAVHATTSPSTFCLLYTSPSPRDLSTSRMPSSA